MQRRAALGPEQEENGCLWLVPGSHRMEFGRERYDDDLFFHCRLLHAAGTNRTALTKFAAVFTYHAADNRPLAETRSASLPDVSLV